MLWGEARTRLTRWMLEVPFETLIGVDTDSIVLSQPHDFYTNERWQYGNIRLKGILPDAVTAPHDLAGLKALAQAAEHTHQSAAGNRTHGA